MKGEPDIARAGSRSQRWDLWLKGEGGGGGGGGGRKVIHNPRKPCREPSYRHC